MHVAINISVNHNDTIEIGKEHGRSAARNPTRNPTSNYNTIIVCVVIVTCLFVDQRHMLKPYVRYFILLRLRMS